MCLVSVIIPVYNVEKYLKKCLDSIINQTHKDIEIICVDDGSTDNSRVNLESYVSEDKRIKIITKKNGGLSSARNAGLDAASGKYILFIDSDDYVDFDLIEELLECIKSNDVDAVVFGLQNEPLDEKSKEIAQKDQLNYERYFKKKTGIYDVSTRLNHDIVACAVNRLYKKGIIDKYNLRFFEGVIQEDTDWLWTYFLHCKNYYYLDKNKYHYMRRCDSIMGKRIQSIHVLDILKIHINIYQNVKKYKNIKDYKKYLTKAFKCVAKDVYNEIDAKYREEFFRIYEEYLKNNFSFYLWIKYLCLRIKRKNDD